MAMCHQVSPPATWPMDGKGVRRGRERACTGGMERGAHWRCMVGMSTGGIKGMAHQCVASLYTTAAALYSQLAPPTSTRMLEATFGLQPSVPDAPAPPPTPSSLRPSSTRSNGLKSGSMARASRVPSPHCGHVPYAYGLELRWAAVRAPTSGGRPDASSSPTSVDERRSGRWFVGRAAVNVYRHGGRGGVAEELEQRQWARVEKWNGEAVRVGGRRWEKIYDAASERSGVG